MTWPAMVGAGLRHCINMLKDNAHINNDGLSCAVVMNQQIVTNWAASW